MKILKPAPAAACVASANPSLQSSSSCLRKQEPGAFLPLLPHSLKPLCLYTLFPSLTPMAARPLSRPNSNLSFPKEWRTPCSTATWTSTSSRPAASPTWTSSLSASAAALPPAASPSPSPPKPPPPGPPPLPNPMKPTTGPPPSKSPSPATPTSLCPSPTPPSPEPSSSPTTRTLSGTSTSSSPSLTPPPTSTSTSRTTTSSAPSSSAPYPSPPPTSHLVAGRPIQGWFVISGKQAKPNSALFLKMQFFPVNTIPRKLGVDRVYFPERTSGEVTLYQDAHVRPGELLPEIELDGGRVFGHEKCWEDICHAILDAHKLIYIVGWSVYHKVRLVREATRPLPKDGDLSLGELLKLKSQEGVRVLLMVWDDKTSHDHLLLKTGGVMQTHDEDTRKFFKHSSVMCVLSPRYAANELSMVKQQIVGTLYTHHQKCLLVDTPASGNNRKITAFLGGLDLCDGRYDTPEHRLFTDLNTVFLDDFHNPTLPGEETRGPRQPWHDLHCKIEGPAAYDVLTNFEQRWRKARFLSFRHFKRISHWRDDALLKLDRISWILSPSALADDLSLPKEDDSENWHVQIFRSIDSGSVKGFPNNVHEAENQNLVFRKNLVVDKSIHTAYVKAIRSAEHFIYIENQYFIGSSYGWPSYRNAEADNLIPMELALKIASKIRSGQQFAVYIVIPMWPEGLPGSNIVQEILFWQRQTIEMMYKIIAQELKSMNVEQAHLQDYLNFYCLGQREVPDQTSTQLTNQPSDNNPVVLSQKYRRFMIYVHAKGMIVDDEYVLLGSANINQRSMDGSRDTEIAMGAYQPNHTWAVKQRHPRGQVYGYRMSLWREHLGSVNDVFQDPHSMDCVRLVNQIADENWARYTHEQIIPLKGHLLKYPIAVEADGTVSSLPRYDLFPDVGGKVLGQHTAMPDNLTM